MARRWRKLSCSVTRPRTAVTPANMVASPVCQPAAATTPSPVRSTPDGSSRWSAGRRGQGGPVPRAEVERPKPSASLAARTAPSDVVTAMAGGRSVAPEHRWPGREGVGGVGSRGDPEGRCTGRPLPVHDPRSRARRVLVGRDRHARQAAMSGPGLPGAGSARTARARCTHRCVDHRSLPHPCPRCCHGTVAGVGGRERRHHPEAAAGREDAAGCRLPTQGSTGGALRAAAP